MYLASAFSFLMHDSIEIYRLVYQKYSLKWRPLQTTLFTFEARFRLTQQCFELSINYFVNEALMTALYSTSFASHAVASFSNHSSNMPVANDWRISPWTDIAEIHATTADDNAWEKRVIEFFEARLASEGAVASLPSLNSTQVHR